MWPSQLASNEMGKSSFRARRGRFLGRLVLVCSVEICSVDDIQTFKWRCQVDSWIFESGDGDSFGHIL